MTDWLLLQMALWGAPLLFVVNFLSCIAVPIPASMVMLTAGAFIATGDLVFGYVWAAAFIGAVLGDQAGFKIGQGGGNRLATFIAADPKRADLFNQAEKFTHKHGGLGIFLTRWALSPLGPYANFAAGAVAMHRGKFTIWGTAGEFVWVTMYLGLGYIFSNQLGTVASYASDISGLLAAGAVALGLGLWLRKRIVETRRGV